jgi:gamma-glutamyltranspeptidase/glutathione hydrolase
MDLQAALDAPTVHSAHFPSSFYPRAAYPARAYAESRIPEAVVEELRARGHEVVVNGAWENGKAMAIRYDAERGVIRGAVSPRRQIGYALGW